MAKQSHTNSKHLVELIESATAPAIAMLAAVDRFAFLGVINTGLPEHEARAALISALPTVKRDDIAIADEEAVRVLQRVEQADAPGKEEARARIARIRSEHRWNW